MSKTDAEIRAAILAITAEKRASKPPIDDDDPTPWCHVCGAMKRADCNCGPIADNE